MSSNFFLSLASLEVLCAQLRSCTFPVLHLVWQGRESGSEEGPNASGLEKETNQ